MGDDIFELRSSDEVAQYDSFKLESKEDCLTYIQRFNELFNKQEEPKIEKMSIKDVFGNSVEANGIELFFNAQFWFFGALFLLISDDKIHQIEVDG